MKSSYDVRMEMEAMLNKLFSGGQPFSPEGGDLILPSETPPPHAAPEIVPVNVPDGKTIYKGYVLTNGKLHLATALKDHAILILTADNMYVHIGKDKRVVTKKDGQKVRKGMLALDDSSAHIEKEYPAILTCKNSALPKVVTPFTTVKEVLLYEPDISAHLTRRSTSQTHRESNMYTLLLRQYLK